MKIIQTSILIVFLGGYLSPATAGTPGLTGQFEGDFQFNAYAHTDLNPNTAPVFMGQAIERINWEWDFDTGIANLRFDQGEICDIDPPVAICGDGVIDGQGDIHGYMLTIGVPITVYSPVQFTDNGDGTYTGVIDFQVFNSVFGNPAGLLEITWEITQTGNTLSVTTIDGDGNGFAGTILGDGASTPVWGGFPFPFEPTWSGQARLIGADSNGDGLLDAQAIALNLNPDSDDTDGDGINDIIELGIDFNHPLDSDNDNVIDALEPGSDANDPGRANGLRFKGRNKARDEVTLILNLSITGQTLAHKTESGDILQGPPGIRFAFDENINGTESGPVFRFQSSTNPGETVTAQLHFSADASAFAPIAQLPEKMLLYYVDTKLNTPGLENTGENYYLLATSQWTKINHNTINIRLQDGGVMDEDGVENGLITTNLALASNDNGDFHETRGNASINIWLNLLLPLSLLLLRHLNTRLNTRRNA